MKNFSYQRLLKCFLISAFFAGQICPLLPQKVHAQSAFDLPVPGVMVGLTPGYTPPMIKGVKIYPQQPFQFDFYIDIGQNSLSAEALEEESVKLIKYFLAALTVPEDELWVNLSPYEKDRIITKHFGETEMGRDLLGQDYVLKQLTASLLYPDDDLGKTFWGAVYRKAAEKFGSTDVPMDTFNKVWIVPYDPIVYQNADQAFVVESELKVMLNEDYVSLKRRLEEHGAGADLLKDQDAGAVSEIFSDLVREMILPEIEREVNEGKNFAQLRQIQNSLILAVWYKKILQDGLLAGMYADKNKTKGIDLEDKQVKEKIYSQYLEAFKKGVYDFIREDYDAATQKIIPRRYFSGGYTTESENGNLKERIKVVMSLDEVPVAQREGFTDYVDGVENGESNVVNVSVAFSRVEGGIDYRDAGIREVLKRRYEAQQIAKGDDTALIENDIQAADRAHQDLDVEPDYITDDGIKVFIDAFELNHAGRDRRAVYARSREGAEHKLHILRLWEAFVARQEGMDAEAAKEMGLGTYLVNWANTIEDNAVKLQRQNLLIRTYFEIEAEGLKVDNRHDDAAQILSQIPVLEEPFENMTLDFFIAGPGPRLESQNKFKPWARFVERTPDRVKQSLEVLEPMIERMKQNKQQQERNSSAIEVLNKEIVSLMSSLTKEDAKPFYLKILPGHIRQRVLFSQEMQTLLTEQKRLKALGKEILENSLILEEVYNSEFETMLEEGFKKYDDLESALIKDEILFADLNDALIEKYLIPELRQLRKNGRMSSELMHEYLSLVKEHLKEGRDPLDSTNWMEFTDEDRARVGRRIDRIEEIQRQTISDDLGRSMDLGYGLQDRAYLRIINLLIRNEKSKWARMVIENVRQFDLPVSLKDRTLGIADRFFEIKKDNFEKGLRLDDALPVVRRIDAKVLDEHFLNRSVQDRWETVRNHSLVREIFGQKAFEVLEKELAEVSLERLLHSEAHTERSVSLGHRLFWLARENPGLKVQLAPFLIMNAWREPGYSGERPFILIHSRSNETILYKFIASLTADQLQQLRAKNIPGLMQIIDTVLDYATTFTLQRVDNQDWLKFKEAFDKRGFFIDDIQLLEKKAQAEIVAGEYQDGGGKQVWDSENQQWVKIKEAVEEVARGVGVSPDITNWENRHPINIPYLRIQQGLAQISLALMREGNEAKQIFVMGLLMNLSKVDWEEDYDILRDIFISTDSKRLHDVILQMAILEADRRRNGDFRVVLMPLENFQRVPPDLQEKVRAAVPELLEGFLGREIEQGHIELLAGVLEKKPSQIRKSIEFFNELDERMTIYSGTYDPKRIDDYMGLAEQEGVLEVIKTFSDYGYQFDIDHAKALAEMAGKRDRLLRDVKEIRKIFPDFKYELESKPRWNFETQGVETIYIIDPYEILSMRRPVGELLEALYQVQKQQGSLVKEFTDGLQRSLRERHLGRGFRTPFEELDEKAYQQFYDAVQLFLEELMGPQGKIKDYTKFYLNEYVVMFLARKPAMVKDVIALSENFPRLFDLLRSNEGMYSEADFMAQSIFQNGEPLNFLGRVSHKLLTPEFLRRFLMARESVNIFAWQKNFADMGVEDPIPLIEGFMGRIKSFDAGQILENAEFFMRHDNEFDPDIFIAYVNDLGINQAVVLYGIYKSIMQDDFSNEILQASGIKSQGAGPEDRARQGVRQLKVIINEFYRQFITSGEVQDEILDNPLQLDLLRMASNFDGSRWKRAIDFKTLVAAFLRTRQKKRADNLPELFYVADSQGGKMLRTGTIRTLRLGSQDFKFQSDTIKFFDRIMSELEWSLKMVFLEASERVNRSRDSILPQIANERNRLDANLDNLKGKGRALRQLESQVANLETLWTGIKNAQSIADLIIALGEFKPKNNTPLAAELRKLLFLQGFFVNDTVAEEFKDRLRTARQVSFPNINLFLEFTNSIIKEHVLGDNPELKDAQWDISAEMKKTLRGYLGFAVFQEEIELMKKKERMGILDLTVVPTRGILGELSGYFCDACWTRQSNIMANNQDTVFLAFIENYEDPANARIVGGTLMIMTSTNGQENFVIRGFNPQNRVADHYDMDQLFDSFQTDYLDSLPGNQERLYSVPHPNSGAFSNRAAVRQSVLSRLGENVSLDRPNNFNGYDITTNNVFLIKSELKEDGVSGRHDPFENNANKDNSLLSTSGKSAADLGGIDLNPAMFNLRIRRDENGAALPMPQQTIEIQNIKIDGLFPVIINITPVTSLPIFLGEHEQEKDTIIAGLIP